MEMLWGGVGCWLFWGKKKQPNLLSESLFQNAESFKKNTQLPVRQQSKVHPAIVLLFPQNFGSAERLRWRGVCFA